VEISRSRSGSAFLLPHEGLDRPAAKEITMSTPKKSLLACVSAAALVASFGFVQAQSSDQDAAAMANVNGGVDRGEDTRMYPSDSLPANNEGYAYDAPAANTAAAEPATSPWAAETDNSNSGANTQAAADANTAAAANTQAAPSGYQRDVGVDGTPCIPEGSVGQRSSIYDPAVSTCATSPTDAAAPVSQAPAAAADAPAPVAAAPTADSNMTVTSAPETRIDLSPPSEPLYNLPPEGERAPRPDRN
jgi:hypothetical protein